MGLTFVTGGARSGKSSLALRLASRTDAPVVFVATAPTDVGMEERIARHRAERPQEWSTVEEPVELQAAAESRPPDETMIVDCITLWVSNLMMAGHDDASIETRAAEAARLWAGRPGETIVVTNEVGSGVHPPTELGVRFQDLLGRVNTTVAGHAQRAFLCVAGRALPLASIEGLEGG
ncbi:MAG TPA: bifunctional adenosylcobinamide kinase/adenosylcobinamide-phosphate guanylyltransferase [Actinomycetota bacterium]|nr:bifunctional adenosylcobinamide kinase/adenosylcobinamide-phosphate guanylyltransferase [Actinomycetota bacterium]